ncbi:MAG TPA: zf-HC2 domain-containing protein [Solirubrobacteraceae bacterium]|nr:zf-HC2 domain-containing protein [Solirubrobacteraceae bacterium]
MTWHLDEDLSCNEVVELVTDYLEDALSDDLRTRVEMHLVMCRGCDVYVGQARGTVDAVAALASANGGAAAGVDGLLEAFRGWRRQAEEQV